MSTISNELVKDLRMAFAVWQQDYDTVEDKEQYDMFGLGIVAMDELLALRKEREWAEPVAWTDSDELRDAKKSGVGYLFGMGAEANKFADPHRKMMLYTAPPAPAHVDEIAAQAGIDPAIADAYMQGCHDTEARQAETDTTSQQFESLAGKAVGGSEGFECTPVADLYELLTKCGECYDYTTSAKVAADWIKEGYSAREYVKLDRLQEALLFAAPEPCK